MLYIDDSGGSKMWISGRQRRLLALLTIGGTWIASRVDDFAIATQNVPCLNKVNISVMALLILIRS